MKHALLIAAATAALGLSACSKKAETPAADMTDAAATDAMAPASDAMGPAATASSAASPGQAFADTAAASDRFELETSKLAASKSQSDKVKRFAEQMIKAHTDSTAKLKAAAAKASPAITPAADLTPEQQQTLTDLSAKSGQDFDQAYANAQRDGHQKTLDALKAYAANGDVPALKALASDMVPIVTGHLNMAKGL